MPRTPQIRYFDSRKAYYTQYQGKQHCLAAGPKDEPHGPTYQLAVQKFSELMHLAEADRAEDQNYVRTVLDLYARHLKNQGREGTLTIFLNCMKTCPFKDIKARDLKLFHVQQWLDEMGAERGHVVGGRGGKSVGRVKKWGQTMKRLAFDKLLTALNWAVDQGLITHNPIVQTKAGGRAVKVKDKLGINGRRSRGRDYVLRPGEHEKLLSVSKPYFADLLTFLEGTGCRPGESYKATAKNYSPDDHGVTFRHDAQPPDFVHKTAKRTEKDRVILLTPDLEELVKRLCIKNPSGPIFTNRDGKPWTNSSVHLMLKRLRKKLDLRGKMIAYSYRHTFATNFLLPRATDGWPGGSMKVLAEMLGTSVAMLEKHYGHLDTDRPALRNVLNVFRAGLPKHPTPVPAVVPFAN